MLSVMVFDALYEEECNISRLLKEAYTQRNLPIKRLVVAKKFTSLTEVAKEQMNKFNVFIASFARIKKEYIEFVQGIRKSQNDVFIVFLVTKDVDISSFVRPSVRPSGILFIPLEPASVHQVIREIYMEHLRLAELEKQPVFTVKTGGEYFSVDSGEILFFEAQGKKIALKTRGQEIAFYANFDTVMEQVTDWFVRCHKGFVVNLRHLVRASFTEMTLTLKDGSTIPISRTYKDEIRMLIESKGGGDGGI